MNAVPDLPESVNQPIEFPTEDESTGMVKIGWRGPDVNVRIPLGISLDVFEYRNSEIWLRKSDFDALWKATLID